MTLDNAVGESVIRSRVMKVAVYVWYNPAHMSPDWRNRYCASYGMDVPGSCTTKGFAYRGKYHKWSD